MPELPEVETLRRSLLPLVKNRVCQDVKFFRKDLRFPIPQKSLIKGLTNNTIQDITRQGKAASISVTCSSSSGSASDAEAMAVGDAGAAVS